MSPVGQEETTFHSSTDRLDEGSEKPGLVKRLVDTLKKKGPSSSSKQFGASQGSLSEVNSLRRGASVRSHLMVVDPAEVPSEAEVNTLFANAMRETLGAEKLLEVMGKLTRESKWQMVCQSGRLEELNQGRYTPDYFVQRMIKESNDDDNDASLNQELASTLRIQLTNQPLSYVLTSLCIFEQSRS